MERDRFFDCPKCKAELKLHPETARPGDTIECPVCGSGVTVSALARRRSRGQRLVRLWVIPGGIVLAFVALTLLVFCTNSNYKWKVMSVTDEATFVYVEPKGMTDTNFIRKIVREMKTPDKPIRALFFDNAMRIPKALPVPDDAVGFYRYFYQFDPGTGYERLSWIRVTDPDASPPEYEEIPFNLGGR